MDTLCLILFRNKNHAWMFEESIGIYGSLCVEFLSVTHITGIAKVSPADCS